MTPEQIRILRPIYKTVLHHNNHVGWELKREIFDSGYQSQYHWALDFLRPAERALGRLSDADKAILIADWKQANKDGVSRSDDFVLGIYEAIVVEEVVRRAEIASNRTINW